MCGIVGAVAKRDVGEILLEGLKRLEYRGYDSAGIAIIDPNHALKRLRTKGKVNTLCELYQKTPLEGYVGIAHTRWATHGAPAEHNAHPLQSGEIIALIHNGIIENYQELREQLILDGYVFTSQTDTEVIAHLIHQHFGQTGHFLTAVRNAIKQLKGAFALAIINAKEPSKIIGVRFGSPLVVGLGFGENFLASDMLALLPVTQKGIYLEDGDIVELSTSAIKIYDQEGESVERKVCISKLDPASVSLGPYRHFMQKEIFEQADIFQETLEGRLSQDKILIESFGPKAHALFNQVESVQIVGCGTSFHAGLVAKHWIENLVNIPCQVDIASEFRYRKILVPANTLFVTISQSGETADTLAALRKAKTLSYLTTLTVCNASESSLVRESELIFITRAGTEIGVAATKTFTAQLTSLLILALGLAQSNLEKKSRLDYLKQLRKLPELATEILKKTDPHIKKLAKLFADKEHTLFLGRGTHYPIALEGALKLKEISYIHAEAYPAGELKHGPLALVDKNMPVIAISPSDELADKLRSNLEEVLAREGQLILFADKLSGMKGDVVTWIPMPKIDPLIAPILYTIPLQLLAYYVAVIKGTDVDHPRNLAKSVTVE